MNVSAREDTSPFSVNDTHILHSARSEVKELDQMSSIEVKNHMRSSNIQFRETEDLCQTCIEEGEMLRTARKWGPYGGVPEEECLIRY
ncbi:hypothetical protein OSK26_24500, partial [Escherichia coli]|nr:hypothetical protein [Escherichia coli]